MVFEYQGNTCDNSFDLVFNKARADDRKEWLGNYNKELVLDTNRETISYSDFINREMIHFSKYDCERSIPNLMDGLKTSQRKILYSAFKRNLVQEIKVAQFAGYVSEHSAYHHGEMSLNKAIVNMAQEYVGSNNINMLLPNGQFGTRLMGGKDSASERYIFTQLNQITKHIYNENDSAVLNYLDDDGTPVEPEFYAPIIPTILVNGSKGIGTGFSTEILNYNPLTLIDYIQNKINGGTLPDLVPYYAGFKGRIDLVDKNKYLFSGNYEIIKDDIIRVTELPIGFWTQDFKDHLESLMETTNNKGKKKNPIVKDYNDMSTDTMVDFTITLYKGMFNKMISKMTYPYGTNELENKLKLITTKSTSNLHLFDSQQRMRKFEKVEDIIDEYFPVRMEYYQKRKDYMIAKLEREVMILHNKARFIEEQCEDKLDLRRKKKEQVNMLLTQRKYDKIDGDDDYKYLVSMPMSSVMEENITKLRKERDDKMKELEILKNTTIETMWNNELENLKKQYVTMLERRHMRQSGEGPKKRKIKLSKKTK